MQTSLLQAHKQAQRLADDADAARIKTVAGAGVIGALCSGGWCAGVRAFGLAARKQRVPVGNFVNGSTVFLLSYTWYLLFATYVFRLHPMPWCASPRLPMWPPEGSAPKAALALSAAGVATRTSRAQPRRRRIASSSSRRFLSLLPVPSRSPSPPNGLFIPVGVFVDQNLLPAEAPTGLGLGYTVVLFCPILTVLVFWKQSAVLNALGRLLDVDVPQVSAENVKTLRSGSKMHMSATCGRGQKV